MYPHVMHPMSGFGQPPHVYHAMRGLGATMKLTVDPASVQCIQGGGKWDPATGTCAAGGIPTWAYIAGAAVVVGGAAWYFLK